MSDKATRLEHDLLGDKAVPADAYYGVQTARGLENFHISGVELRLYPDLIKALGMVKMAAARANADCEVFDRSILKGIEGACQELIDGKLHDQFRLDVFQGGAGLGAIVGGIAGGGTGAAIGAVAGGATGAIMSSQGTEHLTLPAETRLQFTLDAAVTVQP